MNKETEIPSQELPEKEKVALQIGGILDQTNIMGFNDSEIPTLMKLMERVKSGGIDPQVALKEAQEILDRKQSYH